MSNKDLSLRTYKYVERAIKHKKKKENYEKLTRFFIEHEIINKENAWKTSDFDGIIKNLRYFLNSLKKMGILKSFVRGSKISYRRRDNGKFLFGDELQEQYQEELKYFEKDLAGEILDKSLKHLKLASKSQILDKLNSNINTYLSLMSHLIKKGLDYSEKKYGYIEILSSPAYWYLNDSLNYAA
ncbi:MAG: hypothetical protein WC393_01615 [Candidatus Nanoarchaeia archaeon]|jgi:hypothetical protein